MLRRKVGGKNGCKEESKEYPKSIRNMRLRGLYDCLNQDEKKALLLYTKMNEQIPYDFMDSKMKQREAKQIIKNVVKKEESVEEIFAL